MSIKSILLIFALTLVTACKQESALSAEQEAKLQKIFNENPDLPPEQKKILRETLIRAIEQKAKPKTTIPKDAPTCIAMGGDWGKWGPSERQLCTLRTSDAGKPCTSSSQCEMRCVANDSSSLFATGDSAKGHCFGSTTMSGFSGDIIEDGKVSSHLDVD